MLCNTKNDETELSQTEFEFKFCFRPKIVDIGYNLYRLSLKHICYMD